MERSKEINVLEKYLRFPLTILYVFGLWRKNNNSVAYFSYSFGILIFSQYLYALFQVIYMVKVWGDIEKIAEASFLLLTQVTLCVKIILFIWKKRQINCLTESMNSCFFTPSRPAHISIINISSSTQAMEYFVFLSMSSLTIALWAIFPLIDAVPEEKVLPFKAWYPLPSAVSPYYECLYFYQIAGIWFSALINVSIDRLSTSMTAFGCAQVQILKNNLVNIEIYAHEDLKRYKMKRLRREHNVIQLKEKLSYAKELNLYQGNYLESKINNLDDLLLMKLKKYILHHKFIVRFIYKVEECFHWGILAQFVASVGIICVTGLQLTLVNPYSLKFVTKITYLIAMMAQIFFICRIGNDISVISGELIGAAYTSPWIERKRSYNSTLLLFMERLKQPIVTRAGHFFPLSLHTFVSILRSSYSYFAVLQQLNSKK